MTRTSSAICGGEDGDAGRGLTLAGDGELGNGGGVGAVLGILCVCVAVVFVFVFAAEIVVAVPKPTVSRLISLLKRFCFLMLASCKCSGGSSEMAGSLPSSSSSAVGKRGLLSRDEVFENVLSR